MALLSETERARAEDLARGMDHVSLASQPDFQDVFVEALKFQDPNARRDSPGDSKDAPVAAEG